MTATMQLEDVRARPDRNDQAGTVSAAGIRLRRHKRTEANVRAIVRSGSRFQPTLVRDISRSGLGLAGANGLFPGGEVEITLLNGLRRTGVVRWWLAGNCGIQLHEPLADNDVFFKYVLGRATRAIGASDSQ